MPRPLDFLEITIEQGIVTAAWILRTAQTLEEGRDMLEALGATFTGSGLELLLFDSRGIPPMSDELQPLIWEWLVGHRELRKVATVLSSKAFSRQVRVTAVANGIRLKTFDDMAKARQWLKER